MVMKNKKAQMKIQQMAFMLMAITLFFILVGMFALTIYLSNLRGTASSLEESNALLLVSKLSNSPEFSCGNSFGDSKVDCVDSDKVMALKNKSKVYYDFWGVSKIEIIKIYPKSSPQVECNSGNYPNCNVIKIIDKSDGTEYPNFVSLCRKEISSSGDFSDKCEIAKLLVGYKTK